MELRLRELEPEIAQRVRQTQFAVLTETRATRTELEPIWSVFSLACALTIAALYIFLCFRLGGALAIGLLMLSPLLLMLAMALPNHMAPVRVTAPAVRAALGEETLPRAERLYGETLLMILETPVRKPAPLRELLKEVNRLVAEDRVMAKQEQRLRLAVDLQALREAEAEQGQLAERVAQEQDPPTRQALAESLTLCVERVEHLRALPLLLTRLQAHRELLCQALALAHAALLRTRSTPLASIPPEVAVLRASVRQLTSESRALVEATRTLGS